MVFYKKTLLALRCMSDKKVDWPIAFLSGIGNLVPRAFEPLSWGGAGKEAFPHPSQEKALGTR